MKKYVVKSLHYILFFNCMAALMLGWVGCEELDDTISSDPYAGGKEPFDIALSMESPMPSEGYPGDTVVFKAKGVLKYCGQQEGEYRFKFYLGEQESKILAVTDTSLTVEVPYEVSSGLTYLVMDNQVFYGPYFPVLGNVSVDKNWVLYGQGTDGPVYGCLEKYTTMPNYYVVGHFSKIGEQELNGIGFVDYQGNVAKPESSNFGPKMALMGNIGEQLASYIHSISAFDDGRMLVSGAFSAYYSNNNAALKYKDRVYADNIMILESDARIDTVGRMFWETTNNYRDKWIGLSTLNGGTTQEITRSFVTSDQQVVVAGNFPQYICNEYADAFKDNTQRKTDVASVFRMDDHGKLDSLYRLVVPGSRYTGAEGGLVADACMDENDGVVLVGDFTSFDGVGVPGIVRLDRDGNVDQDFLERIGSGPNGVVSMVRYNKKLGRMMLVGDFTEFDGQVRKQVAMLKADGTLDPDFKLKEMTGGSPNFAQLIDRGKVVVSGTFTTYDGVARNGFLILDMDGTAQQKFNVPGVFNGQLYQVQESQTTVGSYGLLLMGKFSRFNSKPVHNILMLELDLEH